MDHLLPVSRTCSHGSDVSVNIDHLPLVAANDVRVGDCLVTMDKKFTRVQELESYLGEGVYTFVVDEADFLVSEVNDTLLSLCYHFCSCIHK